MTRRARISSPPTSAGSMSRRRAPDRQSCCGTACSSIRDPGVHWSTSWRAAAPCMRSTARRTAGATRCVVTSPSTNASPQRSMALDRLGLTEPVDWVGNAWGGHVGIRFATGTTAVPDADHHRHARRRPSRCGRSGRRRWPLVRALSLGGAERLHHDAAVRLASRRGSRCRSAGSGGDGHGVVPRGRPPWNVACDAVDDVAAQPASKACSATSRCRRW